MKKIHSFLKKEQFITDRTGLIICIINLLLVLNSTFFFLFKMKTGIQAWLMLNSCAPSMYLFILGYFLRSSVLTAASSVMMIRWGFLGLFMFSWEGFNIIAQIGHIAMTFTVIYTFFTLIKQKKFKSLIAGLLLGLIITIPYSYIQINWFNDRPGFLDQFFQGNAGLSK
ncbi:MAG: hypothetical protein JW982_12760 [Spirochaetes bacterium]|nr:hypothetical protein [Spirochaetota bacterium]